MQTSGSFSRGFSLQYQEFSRDGHWEHINSGNIDGETVIQSLLWYAADDDRWRTENQWKRLILPPLEPKEKIVKPRKKQNLGILDILGLNG